MLLGILIFPFIIMSCNTEENTEDLPLNKKVNFQRKDTVVRPENADNPYDSVGRLHNEVLDIYLATRSVSKTTEDIMAQIQSITSSDSINIVQDCNRLSILDTINFIVANPQNSAVSIIDNSILSSDGKDNLLEFIELLDVIKTSEYEDIYQFIASYESEILSSTILNNYDKRVILTTSSIVRYSMYYDKKKDRDWDGSVGNFIGAIVGSLDSSLSPVTMALVVGISYNNSLVN